MKVMYICAKHPPYDKRVYYKISMIIKKCGHEVINLTPNTEKYLSEHGIQLVGFPQKRGMIGRIRSLVSLYTIGKELNADVLIAPEPDSLIIAYLIKLAHKRTKVIFDCHEWYDLYFYGKIGFKCLEQILNAFVAFSMIFVCKRIEAVICVNDTMSQYFSKVNPNVYTVPSLPDIYYRPAKKKTKKGFIFFGSFVFKRQETILLDAAQELKNKRCNAQIIVIGGYPPSPEFDEAHHSFNEEIINRGLENQIQYIRWLPREQAYEHLSYGLSGIMRFDPPIYIDRPALPNKLWEYMASRMAIIASDKNKEIKKIILQESCGVLLKEETGEALANAIIYLTQHKEIANKMGDNAYNAIATTYNWEKYSDLVDEILKNLHDD